jgi:hypothetical protein
MSDDNPYETVGRLIFGYQRLEFSMLVFMNQLLGPGEQSYPATDEGFQALLARADAKLAPPHPQSDAWRALKAMAASVKEVRDRVQQHPVAPILAEAIDASARCAAANAALKQLEALI